MGKDIRWRFLLIVVIVGACLWAIVPPAQKIRLGLDLKGGVHLVLRVNTDDALKVGDRIITTSGMYGSITKISDRSVQVQIADKVRIELSKAAIAGYQGQDPVVPETQAQ